MNPTENTSATSRARNHSEETKKQSSGKKTAPRKVNNLAQSTIDNSSSSNAQSQSSKFIQIGRKWKKKDTKGKSIGSATQTLLPQAEARQETETTPSLLSPSQRFESAPLTHKDPPLATFSYNYRALIEITQSTHKFQGLKKREQVEVLIQIGSILKRMDGQEGSVAANCVLQILKECRKGMSDSVLFVLTILSGKGFISQKLFRRQALLVLSNLSEDYEAHMYQICYVIRVLKEWSGKELPLHRDPLFVSVMQNTIDMEMKREGDLNRLITLFNCLENLSLLSTDDEEPNPLLEAFAKLPAKFIEIDTANAFKIITAALLQNSSPEDERALLEKARLCVELAREIEKTYIDPIDAKRLLFSIWDEIEGDNCSFDPLIHFPLFELAIALSRKKGLYNNTSPFLFVFGKETTPLIEKYVLRDNAIRSKLLMENLDRETRLVVFNELLQHSMESNSFADTQILLSLYWEMEGSRPDASFPEQLLPALIGMAANLPESLSEISEKLLIPAVLSPALTGAVERCPQLLLPLLETVARWPLARRCKEPVCELIASLARTQPGLFERDTPFCDLVLKILKEMPYEALERVGRALISGPLSERVEAHQGVIFIEETMLAALEPDRSSAQIERFLRFISETGHFPILIDRVPLDWLDSADIAAIGENFILHLLQKAVPEGSGTKRTALFLKALEQLRDPVSEEVLESMKEAGFLPPFLKREALKTVKHNALLRIFSKTLSTLVKPETTDEIKLRIGRPLIAEMVDFLEAERNKPTEQRAPIDCKTGIIPLVRFALRLNCQKSRALAFRILVLAYELKVAGPEFNENFERAAISWDFLKSHPEARQIFVDSIADLVKMKENKPDVSTLCRHLMKDREQEAYIDDRQLLALYQESKEVGRSTEIPSSMVPALVQRAAELSSSHPELSKNLLYSASKSREFHAAVRQTPDLIIVLLKTIIGWPGDKKGENNTLQVILSLIKEQPALYQPESESHSLFMRVLSNLPMDELLEAGFAAVALRHIQSETIQKGIEAVAATLFQSLLKANQPHQRGRFIQLLQSGRLLAPWLGKIPYSWLAKVQISDSAEEIVLFLFQQKAPPEKKDGLILEEAFSNCLRQVSSLTEESLGTIASLQYCPVFLQGSDNSQERRRSKIELLNKIAHALSHHSVSKEDRKKKGRLILKEMASLLEEHVQTGNLQFPKIAFEKDIYPLLALSNRLQDPLCIAYAFVILACCYRLSIAPQWDVRKLESHYENCIAHWKKISVDDEARTLFLTAIPILITNQNCKLKLLPLSKSLIEMGSQDAVEAGLSILDREIRKGLAPRSDLSRELKRIAPDLLDKAIENLSERSFTTLFPLLQLNNIGHILNSTTLQKKRNALVVSSLKLFQSTTPRDKLLAFSTLKTCQEWIELGDPSLEKLVECLTKLAVSLLEETGDETQFSECEQVVMGVAKIPLTRFGRFSNGSGHLALSLNLYKTYLTGLIQAFPSMENPFYLQCVLRVHLDKFFHRNIPHQIAENLIQELIQCPTPASQINRDNHFALVCHGIKEALRANCLREGGVAFTIPLRGMYPHAEGSRTVLIEALINIVLGALNHHSQNGQVYNTLFDLLFNFPKEEREAVSEILDNFPSKFARLASNQMVFIGQGGLQKMMIVAFALQLPIALICPNSDEDLEKKALEALDWLITHYCSQETPDFTEQAVMTMLWTYDMYLRRHLQSALPLFSKVLQSAKKFPMKAVHQIVGNQETELDFNFLDVMIHTGKMWEHIHQTRRYRPQEDYPLFKLLITSVTEELKRDASDNSAILIQIHTSLLIEAAAGVEMFNGSEEKLYTALEPLFDAYFDCLASSTSPKIFEATSKLCITLINSLPEKKKAAHQFIGRMIFSAAFRHGAINDYDNVLRRLMALIEEKM
ncbi:hypothetical protein [Estrella lausannensis]|uniref:Uncharacterized protein n=1 Tax=Estrella lausannensis TaxID=483423 RepID=A0A0H5DRD3_9BACT|nr:hypothetical protein [Estrella lausannensis]CRX38743.1 hypothetical protein ELAC_1407 [Estrella lausannensis]